VYGAAAIASASIPAPVIEDGMAATVAAQTIRRQAADKSRFDAL